MTQDNDIIGGNAEGATLQTQAEQHDLDVMPSIVANMVMVLESAICVIEDVEKFSRTLEVQEEGEKPPSADEIKKFLIHQGCVARGVLENMYTTEE